MATKVIDFENKSLYELRKEIVEFLKENPKIKIIESVMDYEIPYSVKGQGTLSHEGRHCMILFYEEGG